MRQVGVTECGKKVVDGVFRLTDTIGLPLDIIVQELKDRDMLVAWDVFISDAIAAGWTDKTIRLKVAQAGVTV